jgi:hypothetical protein
MARTKTLETKVDAALEAAASDIELIKQLRHNVTALHKAAKEREEYIKSMHKAIEERNADVQELERPLKKRRDTDVQLQDSRCESNKYMSENGTSQRMKKRRSNKASFHTVYLNHLKVRHAELPGHNQAYKGVLCSMWAWSTSSAMARMSSRRFCRSGSTSVRIRCTRSDLPPSSMFSAAAKMKDQFERLRSSAQYRSVLLAMTLSLTLKV